MVKVMGKGREPSTTSSPFRVGVKLAGLVPPQVPLLQLLLLLLALLAPQHAGAVDASVSLDYSTYVGTPQAGGTGVTQWLGIRYAAPPLGSLRFARPQDPPFVRDPQPADAVSFCCRCCSEQVWFVCCCVEEVNCSGEQRTRSICCVACLGSSISVLGWAGHLMLVVAKDLHDMLQSTCVDFGWKHATK